MCSENSTFHMLYQYIHSYLEKMGSIPIAELKVLKVLKLLKVLKVLKVHKIL